MSIDSSVDVRLHKYAFEGKKSKLKSLLKKEANINLEALDLGGHTALYYACLNGHKGCVKLLLESHANPNERCKNGETAVHAATKSGNTKILGLLIQYGGDLRLHDNEGRAPRAWAMYQTNPNLRRKMLSFIEEIRYKAIQQASAKPSATYQQSSSQYNIKGPEGNACSVGFGTLFKSSTDVGVPILVPVINENELVHDNTGLTINNGAFMVYESMKWKDKHFVTVKRLHGNTVEGGCVDLLIEELEILSRINYSKIIQLMGICQTQNIESLILMFERIEKGSLFYLMHEERSIKAPKLKSIVEIMLTICNALIYLHEQNIVHCYVNSHSVLIVSPHIVKLGNLEFAVEKAPEPSKQKRSRVVDSKYTNCAYNWLAPEIMDENDLPNEMSDMYSFCCLFWELFNVAIPWADMDWKQIRDEVLVNNATLPINFDLIPLPFSRIIKDGLNLSSINRMSFEDVKANLESVRNMIYAAKKTASMKKSSAKKAAAAAQLKASDDQYGEVPVDVPGASRARPVRSRSEAYNPSEKNMRKQNTVDDVKSLDSEANVANSMATFNSQEFDELSRMTGNSFIYCDAYKAEIHLRKGTQSQSTKNRPMTTSVSNNSGLYTLQDGEKQRSIRTSPNIEQKIESRRRSKRIPRSCTVRPDLADETDRTVINPNINDSLKKARAASLSQPPPPPPPPPAPMQPASAKYRSASANSASYHQHQQHRHEDQQLPQSSYTRPNTIPSLPLPPSFAETSSPTKSQPGLRKLRSVSTAGSGEPGARSERASPILKQTSPNSACGLLERKRPFSQRLSSFESGQMTTDRSANRFSSPAPRVDSNNNHLQRSDSATPPPRSSDNADTASARRNKFKLLETLYYSNSNLLLNPTNKQRLFEAIQRQQMARREQQHQQQPRDGANEQLERENPFRAQLVPNVASGGSSANESAKSPGLEEPPIRSGLLSSIRALSKDPASRIDTQTFYSMAKKFVANEETDPESSAHLPPPPSDFELSTKLSGFNTTKNYREIKSMFDHKATASTPLDEAVEASAPLRSRASLTNKLSKSFSNLRQAHAELASSASSNMCGGGADSECGHYTAVPRRRLVMKTTSLHSTNQHDEDAAACDSPRRLKSRSVDASHRSRLDLSPSHSASGGAVKNLVLSYEEIPFKEENESKHKVQLMREQRNKEMLNVVEQSRLILHGLATLNEFGDTAKSEQSQKQLESCMAFEEASGKSSASPSPQQQHQQRPQGQKGSAGLEEIQSTTPCVISQPNERPEFQNLLLQKELSTISERTEHSSSVHCLATIAGSTVNTSFTAPSPQITNAHSNSRLNSVTKSVRHLDPSKFNFLDMTSTTIAGSGGNISATGGSSEYLVGNNTLTTTVSSASTMKPGGAHRASSSYTPPKPSRSAEAAAAGAKPSYHEYDNGHEAPPGDAVAGRYIKNARKSFRYSKQPGDSPGESGAAAGKGVYDYNNTIMKEHFRNIDIKADQLNHVSAHNTERDTYGAHAADEEPVEEDEEASEESDCEESDDEQNEYQSKMSRTPYSAASHAPDSHRQLYETAKFNPNHCNDCMQKFLEQQLIEKSYEHQQQNMSPEYSSQEDILSSLRGGGCVESPSMELSEAIYLNEFEMLSKREDGEANGRANPRFSRAASEASRPSAISESTENLRKNFYSAFDRQAAAAAKKRPSRDEASASKPLPSNSSNEQLLDESNYMNVSSKAPATRAESIRASKSHSNIVNSPTSLKSSSKTTAPLNECSSPSTNSIMATTPAAATMTTAGANVVSSKLGNVRLDKHIIDMSKYKDYIYKLETRSDVSNQYFIKSLLTNQQTGHSLVLSQTKVKTPKMLTKLIIDQ